MKGIKLFIKEAIDEVDKVGEFKVQYSAKNSKIVVCVPNTYSESDMQIYIDDKVLPNMPCTSKESKRYIGDNNKNISDAYFEYEGYSASDEVTSQVDIEWDPKYDDGTEGAEYMYYTLNNLKFIVQFSDFSIKNSDNPKDELEGIFKALESNNTNKYPIDIEFEKIEYDEQ